MDAQQKRLSTLFPQVAERLRLVLREMKERGYEMIITDGSRSWAEQNALFAKGRTAGGKIVTNARGGYSYHNYKVAADCAFLKDGRLSYEGDWNLYGYVAKKYGFEWGGDWTSFQDRPHVQMTFGYDVYTLAGMGESKALEALGTQALKLKKSEVSDWAVESFKKASKYGYTDRAPLETIDPVRLRHIFVKHPRYTDHIEDNGKPLTYQEIIKMFDKAGDL